MGLFDFMFPKKEEAITTTRFEMVSDSGNGFYTFGNNLYKSDIVRSCIRPFSKAVGKLVAKHILSNKQIFKVNPNVNIRFLLEEPNPLMSGQLLQEKIATQLKLNNNAFIYMKYDEYNFLSELWPIPAQSVEAVEGSDGNLYLKFYFSTGKHQTIPYQHIIHLRNDYNQSDLFGDSPRDALLPLMDVITTTDQGVVKAIKNSAVVKWIMKFNAVLKKEDIQKNVEDFTRNYLSIENAGGAAASDPRYDLQQVKQDNYVPDQKQTSDTIKRVYAYFGTNEKIIMSNYTEDEWVSYFEAEIEPFSMQLSNEFTRKIFTRRERGFGNSIIFEASSLQHASMKTKLNLMQMVDRGALVPNEWRLVMNLAPIEGGDVPIRRLDTAIVDNNNQSEGGENNE